MRRYVVALATLSLALPTCAPEGGPGGVAPEERLRRAFPAVAAAVLEADEAFADEGDRFTRRPPPAVEGRAFSGALSVAIPKRAGEAVRIAAGPLRVAVREVGARGAPAAVGAAVVHGSAGGTSFWAAAPGGVEEWLHLDAVTPGAPAAAWEVEGATPRQEGDAVTLLDEEGTARIRITAPAAYASGGRAAPARLAVQDGRIEVFVEASGEVLVDPMWVSTMVMASARSNHTATLLPDGRVLVPPVRNLAMFSACWYAPRHDRLLAVGEPAAPWATHRAAPADARAALRDRARDPAREGRAARRPPWPGVALHGGRRAGARHRDGAGGA